MSESSATEPGPGPRPGPRLEPEADSARPRSLAPLLGTVATLVSIASLWAFAAADAPPRLGRLSPALAVAALVGLLVARRRGGGVLIEASAWFAAVVVATEAAFLILSRV